MHGQYRQEQLDDSTALSSVAGAVFTQSLCRRAGSTLNLVVSDSKRLTLDLNKPPESSNLQASTVAGLGFRGLGFRV